MKRWMKVKSKTSAYHPCAASRQVALPLGSHPTTCRRDNLYPAANV